MTVLFYIAAITAVTATLMVITRRNAVHALLYMVVSLLSVAVIFYILGAPFVAALELIVYAGAIMVVFIFVIMMLNLGEDSVSQESQWLTPYTWTGPGILSLILIGETLFIIFNGEHLKGIQGSARNVGPAEVGRRLYGEYILAVELAAILLMAGLVGAYHLGRRHKQNIVHRYLQKESGNGTGAV